MDTSFDPLSSESNNIWKEVMNKLIELKEWQKMEEELVRRRQWTQITALSDQNIKLNIVLTKTDAKSDDKQRIHGSDGCVDSQTIETPVQPMDGQTDRDQSIEEFRGEDNCHQMSGNNSFGNNSFAAYLEDSPVIGGIDGKKVKTFEELLDLRLNSDKNIDLNKNTENKPKKPFLRRGDGIKRFAGNECQTKKSSKQCLKQQNPNPNQYQIQRPNQKPNPIPNKRVSFDSFKTKHKEMVKQSVNKKSDKRDENPMKPKVFKRKVIPMTTKSDNNKNKSVFISRNTPIVVKDLSESENNFFEFLQQICGNISVEDSFEEKFKDRDINELQDLLKKIELKKNGIQRQLSGSDVQMDEKSRQLTKKANNCQKKTVRWSHNTHTSDESDDQLCDFEEPKSGAYSLSLIQQINQLEDRLSQLKPNNTDKVMDSGVNGSGDGLQPLNGELKKFREQLETLNKRVINIESNSYDLIAKQKKNISNQRQCVKSFVERNAKTLPKVITSPNNGLNISVDERPNDTTIDFPNGDKMTVSKDNTIFYTFTSGATQTTYPDGLKITEFPNGQIEKMDKKGVKRITYANGLQRTINPDSSEEVFMTDGTIWRIHSDGSEVLEFMNGDREIRTDRYKRREYSNGNIKTLYSDGTQETRYVCGRLRIKDRFGNLMVDSVVRHLDQHIGH